jgi:hypothetical protein
MESGYPDKDILGTYPKRVYTSGADQALRIYLLERTANFDFDCKSSLQGFRVNVIHFDIFYESIVAGYHS